MGLPDRIKIVRDSMSLNQKDMAKALGVSLTALQGYEAGRSVPGGNVFEALVKLGFNSNWLLTGEGLMKRSDAVYPLADGYNNGSKVEDLAAEDLKRASDDSMREAILNEIKQLHGKKLKRFMRHLLELLEQDEDEQS